MEILLPLDDVVDDALVKTRVTGLSIFFDLIQLPIHIVHRFLPNRRFHGFSKLFAGLVCHQLRTLETKVRLVLIQLLLPLNAFGEIRLFERRALRGRHVRRVGGPTERKDIRFHQDVRSHSRRAEQEHNQAKFAKHGILRHDGPPRKSTDGNDGMRWPLLKACRIGL